MRLRFAVHPPASAELELETCSIANFHIRKNTGRGKDCGHASPPWIRVHMGIGGCCWPLDGRLIERGYPDCEDALRVIQYKPIGIFTGLFDGRPWLH